MKDIGKKEFQKGLKREKEEKWLKKKEMWKKYSNSSYIAIYDKRYAELQLSKFQTLLKMTKNPQIFVQDLGLDLGGGTGLIEHFLHEFLLKHPNLFPYQFQFRLINVDLSFAMLREGLKKFHLDSGKKLWKAPILICADAENLPLRSKMMGYIISITVLQNIPDMRQGLSEFARVTDASGVVLCSILKKALSREEFTLLLENNWNQNQTSTDKEKNSIQKQGTIEIIVAEEQANIEDWLAVIMEK